MRRLSPVAAVLLLAAPAAAAPIGAGATAIPSVAIQDITLLPNTPFNPTGSAIPLEVSGVGALGLNRAAQVGTTIDITSLFGGQYFGSHPALGSYVFGNVPPLTGADFSGRITNVVQDPADPGFAAGSPSSFRSGQFTFGGNSFGFTFLTGPAAGVTLYTDPAVPFEFEAPLDGLPPSAGTTLVNRGLPFSPDALNVYLGDPAAGGLLVATSSNRRIVALVVPEPATLGLVAVGGLAAFRRRRTG